MRGYAIDRGADRIVGKAPCLNCPDRYVGCQGKCEKYLSWKQARDEFRADAYAHEKIIHEADVVHFDGVEKALRRRGKKVVDKRQ